MQLEAAALLFLFIYTQWWAVRAARMAEESDSTKREYLYTREKKKWQTTCVGNDVAIFYDYDKFSCVFFFFFAFLSSFAICFCVGHSFIFCLSRPFIVLFCFPFALGLRPNHSQSTRDFSFIFFFSGENQLKYWGDLDGVIRVLK